MNKKKTLITLLVFGSVLYFWFFSAEQGVKKEPLPRQNLQEKNEMTPSELEVGTANQVETAVQAAEEPVAEPPPQDEPPEKDPPQMGAEPIPLKGNQAYGMVTKKGYVLIFGDVLLGKLKGPNVKPGSIFSFKAPPVKYWPSNTIYYAIDEKTITDENLKRSIEIAVSEFYPATGVKFEPRRTNVKDFIYFTTGPEYCASYLGYQGGGQPIYLTKNCGSREIIHELMHALGFIHEQSRPDRDKYVKIHWQNILPGKETQFTLATEQMFEPYVGADFFFDYESVMMYPPNAFARDPGLKTIESLTSEAIAPANGLSEMDIRRVNSVYGRE